MVRYKLGDTAHEAMISLVYYMTKEEAEATNVFQKSLWKITVERQDDTYKLLQSSTPKVDTTS